jgi:hypothetical protein
VALAVLALPLLALVLVVAIEAATRPPPHDYLCGTGAILAVDRLDCAARR